MDAIDRLLAEHREIRREIENLKRALRDLAARGEAARADVRAPLDSVTRMMRTTLLGHAAKEDDALFPAMERVFGRDGSPTGVLHEEHRQIRAQAELFQETLHELNEVEHPAIVAGGARLAALTAGAGSARELVEVGEAIVELLELHFAKEEDILFPMAREVLDASALGEVERKMDRMGAASR